MCAFFLHIYVYVFFFNAFFLYWYSMLVNRNSLVIYSKTTPVISSVLISCTLHAVNVTTVTRFRINYEKFIPHFSFSQYKKKFFLFFRFHKVLFLFSTPFFFFSIFFIFYFRFFLFEF